MLGIWVCILSIYVNDGRLNNKDTCQYIAIQFKLIPE